MTISYTANGEFLFKCKDSMLNAVSHLEKLVLISKCKGNYGLYADSEEFHAVNVMDDEKLSFTLAFGVYDDLLNKMANILPLCREWELDFYSFDKPMVGSWENGAVNMVDDNNSLLRLIEGKGSEKANDAIVMMIDEFEEKYETSDYYEELERALQMACHYVWAKPEHINQ